MDKLPEVIRRLVCASTSREWKVQKRAELRELERAAKAFSLGCAYLPKDAFDKTQKLRDLIKGLRKDLSIVNWGR